MTLLDEALSLLRELRPHAPIESAWLTDPNARFDEEAWRNSPVATSSKMRDRIDDLLTRAEKETGVRCTCKDYPGADQFCTAHKVRPAHTAAHDCACAECVKAETRACPRCGYQTPILNGVCNICAERPTQL